ncbi:hypothetical protein KCU90_g128, partial [Aureobasidium melanogenum]
MRLFLSPIRLRSQRRLFDHMCTALCRLLGKHELPDLAVLPSGTLSCQRGLFQQSPNCRLTKGSVEASPVFCQGMQKASMRDHNHNLLFATEQPRAELCSPFLDLLEELALEFQPSSTAPKSILSSGTLKLVSQRSPALTCLSSSSRSNNLHSISLQGRCESVHSCLKSTAATIRFEFHKNDVGANLPVHCARLARGEQSKVTSRSPRHFDIYHYTNSSEYCIYDRTLNLRILRPTTSDRNARLNANIQAMELLKIRLSVLWWSVSLRIISGWRLVAFCYTLWRDDLHRVILEARSNQTCKLFHNVGPNEGVFFFFCVRLVTAEEVVTVPLLNGLVFAEPNAPAKLKAAQNV